ncbi:YcaO-like family protein [Nonomuraea sp. LPB2021202275-12-8]|uniref:YcaO-like family protein n=1 Tax=Nonomuraea sp. LPB2021202275-12-8 TaxID=3120159 RepID=UPI00300D7BA2
MTTNVIGSLVSPAGIVSSIQSRRHPTWPERLQASIASIGLDVPGCGHPRDQPIPCGGAAWEDVAHTHLLATAEGAERYAAADLLGEERIWATARELDGECLDPERYPRCSAREYARPECPLVPFDSEARIRWTRGLDLVSQQEIWLPAVMACYGLADVTPAEKFTYRISTGFAVHTDPVEAAVLGIFEVIERDMIATTWLQQLPLPLLDPGLFSDETSELIAWCRDRFTEIHLFDATTDLGVPTVYCLVTADHDASGCRSVGASTGRTLGQAVQSALFEGFLAKDMLRYAKDVPNLAHFSDVSDGSRYMGVAERARAFDFLLEQPRTATARHSSLPQDPDQALSRLTEILAAAGARPVVVDRTPSELADVGLHAVNVVIPDLQPMSLLPFAQFKGHPRLYEAPRRMGYRVLSEKELNPWPQPFG